MPFELDGYAFHTSASIGIALFRGTQVEVDDLLKRADLAMYEAKAAGRGSLRFFEPSMQQLADERLALVTELREALRTGGLQLVYQPQFDADGRCFAAEALVRWDNPKRGNVDPNEFVPLAERNGLVGGPRRIRAEERVPGAAQPRQRHGDRLDFPCRQYQRQPAQPRRLRRDGDHGRCGRPAPIHASSPWS